jgi:hypothetical protein
MRTKIHVFFYPFQILVELKILPFTCPDWFKMDTDIILSNANVFKCNDFASKWLYLFLIKYCLLSRVR